MSAKYRQPKKPLKKRTKFTIVSVINIIWYTIVVLVASFFDHSVPSELTIAWFAAWTTELALLYGLKIKDKNAINDSINDFSPIQDENNMCDYDEDVG